MTLTHEDVAALTDYFQPHEHELLKGMTYITEGAVTRRIETVDPAWTLKIYDVRQRDKTVTAIVQLTIKGVSRDGVGMAVIQYDKDTKQIEVNEAEKSATTDALKRAARLFGIGRYLLDLPDDVRDMKSLTAYLKSRQNAPAQRTNQPQDRQAASNPKAVQTGASGGNSGNLQSTQITQIKVVRVHDKNWLVADNDIWIPSRQMFRDILMFECEDWTQHNTIYKLPYPVLVWWLPVVGVDDKQYRSGKKAETVKQHS